MRIVYDDTQTNTKIDKALEISYSHLSNALYSSLSDTSDCHMVWALRSFDYLFPYSDSCRLVLKEKSGR